MATGRIVLPVPGNIAPDGTSGNIPAQPAKVTSSGSAPSNAPKVFYYELLFDGTTDEHWLWSFPIPTDYASGGTVRLLWGAKVTTGDVIWKAAICPVVLSSTDLDASVFLGPDLSSAVTVPGTVGHIKETTIALTVTGLAASQLAILMIGRDANNGSDTAAGDANLVGLSFEYVI